VLFRSADGETDADAKSDPDARSDAEAKSNGDAPEAKSGDGRDDDKPLPSAPSIGPNTVIEKPPPHERLDFDKISDTDAMGKDKRRDVVGKTYGPTRARVFGTFAAFLAIVAALTVGFYFLAKELDQPPAENPDVAPWSEADAQQKPPKPLQ
jgi:hypothetical protein